MRILIISNLFPPEVIGGYELGCANTAMGLHQKGHDVMVMTPWSHLPIVEEFPFVVDRSLDQHWHIPAYVDYNPVVHREVFAAVCSSYGNTVKISDKIKSFKPDIVYLWNLLGLGGLAIIDLLNLVDIPWALHLMDRVPVDISSNLSHCVMGIFNGNDSDAYANAKIFSMSQTLLDEIQACSGLGFPQGTVIVPGAVDLSASIPHGPYKRDGVTRFVTAGTLAEHKGIGLILEASRLLKEKNYPFLVDIYGDGNLSQFVNMAKRLDIDNVVSFLGVRSQKELLKLYSGYDSFLFPTWPREPFGFAPVEAAGCGTPPIMTWECGASERMVDGVHCIKIDRSTEELHDAMEKVISGEIDIARIGKAGIRLVSSDLAHEEYIKKVEAELQNHTKPWSMDKIYDPYLHMLLFLKNNLAYNVRFG